MRFGGHSYLHSLTDRGMPKREVQKLCCNELDVPFVSLSIKLLSISSSQAIEGCSPHLGP